MTRRFRQTMKGSFFGDFVYNQVIPADHFLLQADPFYQVGLRLRNGIEDEFGEARAFHSLDRCRYRSLDRFKIQSQLTFMALNRRRIMLLLTATRFRPLAK